MPDPSLLDIFVNRRWVRLANDFRELAETRHDVQEQLGTKTPVSEWPMGGLALFRRANQIGWEKRTVIGRSEAARPPTEVSRSAIIFEPG